MPREHRSTDMVPNIGQNIARGLGQRGTRSKTTSIAREPEGFLSEVFFEQVSRTIAARRGNFDGKLAKSRPEFSGPGRIVGMKGADRALLRKVLGGGADGSKVKDEYLHPAQDAPDRFVIVRYAHVAQVRSERVHKSSHVVTC
jgi:hypothetical protein